MKGVGHVYLRGRIWWIKWHLHGRPRYESSHSESKAKALELLRKRMRSRTSPSEERVSYEDLEQGILQDYEIKKYRSMGDLANVRLKHVRGFFRGQRAVDITTPRLRQYAMMRRKQGAADETINRELSVIRRMFRIATQDQVIGAIPYFPMLEPGAPREVYITQPEFDLIMSHLSQAFHGIVRFVWNTGWRITAVCKLEWRDVHQAEGYFELRRENAKNKRSQRLPLIGELADIIQAAAARRQLSQPRVFHIEGRPFRRESVWRAFKVACAKAGLPNKTVHDMRRAGARDLVRAGTSEDVAQKITGHRTRAVFARYNISADEDITLAMTLLAEYRARQAEQPSTVTKLSPAPRRNGTETAVSSKGKS
jgi:integrase